jgi:hypothetical protein
MMEMQSMNTLSRAVTARFFATSSDYQALRAHWRSLLGSTRRRELTATHHLLYLCLMGKDWRRAFRLTTSQRRLANGAFVGWPLFGALARLRYCRNRSGLLVPFDGLVTEAMVQVLLPLLPDPWPSRFQPEQFADGCCPFDAYLPGAEAAREA